MTLLSLHSRRILYVVLLAGLCGCAVWPQPPLRPVEPTAPAGWQGGSAPTAAAPVSSPRSPWWKALQDPQLDALQALALRTNIDTLRKALSWQTALTQARLTALNQQPSPTLTLNTSVNHALQSRATSVVVNGMNVPVSNAASTTHNYGSNTGLSYELDLWSKLAQTAQRDRVEADSRRDGLLIARWLVSTKVAEAYWTIAAIDAKLPILTELSQAADEALGIVHLRMKEGKISAHEVDVAVTEQYGARKRFADAQVDRSLKLHELALLLDNDRSALAPGEARLPAAEPAEPDLGTPAQTLERRPDVRQARLAVDAALAGLHVAEASRYPALNLSVNLGTNGTTWRHWFSQPMASLGQSLAVPLVDWRRLNAQRDIARNTLDDAALALRANVRQALVDVEIALLERERWQHGWQAAQMQRVEREKVFAVARLRQDVGVFGRLDVLQSKEAVLMAQIDIIDLRLEAWINLLNLYRAIGGAV